MAIRTSILIVLALVMAAGCSDDAAEQNGSMNSAASDRPAELPLMTGDGGNAGAVRIEEDATGLTIRIAAVGLEPGAHAVHLHTVGRCEGPSFESAGPHWNPTGKQHGRDNPRGAHMGDLANLDVGQDGRGASNFALPGVRLQDGQTPLVDLDGAALVIHARADDYKTDPSGDSGDRIACATLEA